MRFARLFAGTLAVAAFAVAPAAAGAAQVIQPGAYSETANGSCTLNFIYDGTGSRAGKVYAGTAAHCTSAVGEAVYDWDGALIGRVAAFGDPNSSPADWGLIEIDAGALSRVNPAMKAHPQYPTGVTTPPETAVGDLVQLSGYGVGFSTTNVTREQRKAVVTYDDTEEHTVLATLIFGDSGGPLVHIKTGKAFGIVSRLCVGLCEEMGPTVQGFIAKATAAGFPIQLRTV